MLFYLIIEITHFLNLASTWVHIGEFKCGNKHWKGPQPTLDDCKSRCKGFYYMTYVERGDRNCGCTNGCNEKMSCPSSNCDSYEIENYGKIKFEINRVEDF